MGETTITTTITSQRQKRAERSTTKSETIAEEEIAKAGEREIIEEDEAGLPTRRPLIDYRMVDEEEGITIVAEETKIVVVAVAGEEMVDAAVDVSVEEETVEIGGREMNTKMTKRGKTTMILCQ